MMKIVKTELEKYPRRKLICKRYTDADRNANGTFSDQWALWMEQHWFEKVGCADDCIGLIRCNGNGFEYDIGVFQAADAPDVAGFDSVLIEAGTAFVCYLYGHEETGELYGEDATNRCLSMLETAGFHAADKGWLFERYHDTRFLRPDKAGCVVLDFGVYLED